MKMKAPKIHLHRKVVATHFSFLINRMPAKKVLFLKMGLVHKKTS